MSILLTLKSLPFFCKLAENGADLDMQEDDGWTALFFAAFHVRDKLRFLKAKLMSIAAHRVTKRLLKD